MAGPAKPTTTQLTIADKRRILHIAQVMQMNPRYTALHRALLANLERWLRTLIKMELGAERGANASRGRAHGYDI